MMTDQKHNPKPPDEDADVTIRERILHRAKVLTTAILNRVTVAVNDLSAGNHRAALGALAGVEQEIATVRSILLLLA
jgi:hypothetical protein